jgi:hypothetical protein
VTTIGKKKVKGDKEMEKTDRDQIDKIIQSLDTAVGMLVVTAMKGNVEVKKAMEVVSQASFLLGQIIE